ncbi:MAG: SiaB family protein kinase [Flavobacteriales bacterium]
MLERIHELYDSLERQRVLISFKGALTDELITALLGAVERKMTLIESDPKARKRVFNVVMECLQNQFHHQASVALPKADGVEQGAANGMVMIAHTDKGYSILTGNFMAADEVERLRAYLDRINNLTAESLRDLYREKLNNGTFSDKGGGGLGILDIARKSGGKLEYGFVPYDQGNTFFSLNVNVTT